MATLVRAHAAASFLLALIGPPSASAQARPIPSISLDRGATEFAESFSQLTTLVELHDGRLIALDSKEKDLRLLDLARGTVTRVSRLGGGPLEYQVPGVLLSGPTDTIIYFDMMQRRFLVLSRDGVPVRTVPYGVQNGGGSPGQMASLMSQMMPTSTDAKGFLYGQTMGMSMPTIAKSGPSMPTFADTVEIQALDPRSGRSTTLARIRSPMAQASPKIEMTGTAIRMTITAPDFRPGEVWAVLPDGRLAILRDGVYRVHFIAAGHPETLGPTIPFTPVPVTSAERKAVVDSLRASIDKSVATMRKSFSQAGGTAGTMPTVEARVVEPSTWATNKPAYNALMSSPDGRLWVALSTPTGAKMGRLDVLDATGALLAHIQLAPGEKFTGLGRGTVYTVRTDEDDLQHLRRYMLPKLP
jgi:hypothetical protein